MPAVSSGEVRADEEVISSYARTSPLGFARVPRR